MSENTMHDTLLNNEKELHDAISNMLSENDPILLYTEENVSDKTTQNVLLLALSTFPKSGQLSETEFTAITNSDTEVKIIGRYQMDPIPAFINEQGKTLDRVILLCTPDTLQYSQITDTADDNNEILCSPLSYFINRLSVIYNPRPKLTVINVKDEPSGITNAVRVLLDLLENKQVNLYIDPHGGPRNTQQILTAIVSLLKRNPNLSSITTYDLRIGDNTIQETQEPLNIYDFVSGINEFISYGRIDSLERYENQLQLSGKNSVLLNAIKKVSDGISMCDISTFESGLRDISEHKKETTTPSESNSYLELFTTTIYDDYGELIPKKSDDPIPLLEELQWCLRKGFYQQTITLIEARTADELERLEVLNIDKDSIKNETDETIAEDNNTIFNGLLFWMNDYFCKPISEHLNDFNNGFNSNAYEQRRSPYRSKYNFIINNKVTFSVSILFKDKNTKVSNCITFNVLKKNIDILLSFLWMHKVIKNELRNNINHVNNTINFDISTVNKVLTSYIQGLKKLDECRLNYERTPHKEEFEEQSKSIVLPEIAIPNKLLNSEAVKDAARKLAFIFKDKYKSSGNKCLWSQLQNDCKEYYFTFPTKKDINKKSHDQMAVYKAVCDTYKTVFTYEGENQDIMIHYIYTSENDSK